MTMRILGDGREETKCPYCDGTIVISYETSVDVDVKPLSFSYGHVFEYSEVNYSRYEKRLPNIGALGTFYRGFVNEKSFLINGYLAFRDMNHLEIDIDLTRSAVDLSGVASKFSYDLPQVYPDIKTNAYVRMVTGENDKNPMTLQCRNIDLAYALYPDAVFYRHDGAKRIFVVSGQDCELVGMIASMSKHQDVWENAPKNGGANYANR